MILRRNADTGIGDSNNYLLVLLVQCDIKGAVISVAHKVKPSTFRIAWYSLTELLSLAAKSIRRFTVVMAVDSKNSWSIKS
jgi:hypothetical protein